MTAIGTAAEVLRLDSVDDYLGPAAGRYFGSGFRRVEYSWVEESTPADAGFRTAASVGIPGEWSRKATGALRPHLSTIDALILGVRAAEVVLRRSGALSSGGAWLRRVDIKAGNAPIEDELGSFAVAAAVVATAPVEELPGRSRTTVRGPIATMTVTCEVEHDTVAGASADALPEGDPTWWGEGYRAREQRIRQVRVREGVAAAALTVDAPAAEPGQGRIDAGPSAAVSMLDSFVTTLQLGQILLYEADGLTRADSDTLWMRHTSITAAAPVDRPADAPAFTTSLADSRRFAAAGATWRTATIHGTCAGLETRCSVAHRVP